MIIMKSSLFKQTQTKYNYENLPDEIYQSGKIEIKKSELHGYGLFANQDIKSGELLEECHFIEIDNPKNNLAEYA